MARREFQRAGSLLPGVLGRLASDSGSARALAPMWPELVGEAIARVSRPVKLEDGVLSVEVASAAWVRELAEQEPALRARVRTALGAAGPRWIRFHLALGGW